MNSRGATLVRLPGIKNRARDGANQNPSQPHSCWSSPRTRPQPCNGSDPAWATCLRPGNSLVHSPTALLLVFQPTNQLSGTRFADYSSSSVLLLYKVGQNIAWSRVLVKSGVSGRWGDRQGNISAGLFQTINAGVRGVFVDTVIFVGRILFRARALRAPPSTRAETTCVPRISVRGNGLMGYQQKFRAA